MVVSDVAIMNSSCCHMYLGYCIVCFHRLKFPSIFLFYMNIDLVIGSEFLTGIDNIIINIIFGVLYFSNYFFYKYCWPQSSSLLVAELH